MTAESKAHQDKEAAVLNASTVEAQQKALAELRGLEFGISRSL